MLKKFIDMLSGGKSAPAADSDKKFPDLLADKNGQPVSREVVISITAILINIASADEDIAEEEAAVICALLDYNLDLHEEEIPAVIESAVSERREKGAGNDFTAALNNIYAIDQRIRILAMAWKLALADNKIEKAEEKMLIKIASMLYLTLDHQKIARSWAEEGRV